MSNDVIFLGDIHGNFGFLKNYVDEKRISNCTMVQVGDFGMGFNSKVMDRWILEDLNDFFGERQITFLAIRGNHDDPLYFDGTHDYENIKLLPDYTVMDIGERRFLFIGGAVSIDRVSRIGEMAYYNKIGESRTNYWSDEVVEYRPEKLEGVAGIDVVVTHTAPSWCHPVNANGKYGYIVEKFIPYDVSLTNDLDGERKILDDVFKFLEKESNVSLHVYGHYHASKLTIEGGCNHYLLGINEFKQL